MYKTLRKLFILISLLLLTLFSVQAAADDVYPYDIGRLSISYSLLGKSEKQLFDSLYKAIRSGKKSVSVPKGLSLDDVWQVLHLMNQETAELIAFDCDNTTVSYRALSSSKTPSKINIAYRATTEAQDDFIATLKYMVAPLEGYGSKSGFVAIHDYICRQIDYDLDAVNTGNTSGAQRFYDALSTNKGVCNAYAQGMTVLCHFAGYTASYINGTVGPENGLHAWNIVLAGDKYTYVDATWDDRDNNGDAVHVFCGAGYERFYLNRRDAPDTPVYSLFPKGAELGTLISDENTLAKALGNAVAERTPELMLKFTPEAYSRFTSGNGAVYGELAGYGIQSESSTLYDDGSAVIFHGCSYTGTVFFSHSGKRAPDLRSFRQHGTAEFIVSTDAETMRDYIAGKTAPLGNALAMEGLLPGNYTLLAYHSSNYFKVENAVWKDVNVCRTESELKSLLKSARKKKRKELTVVLDLSLFGKLMDNDCKKFKSVLSECKVYGSFTYYDCGAVLLSGLKY